MDYLVPMKLTFNTTVVVEAASEEEAREKAQKIDLDDDGMSGAELCDWEVTGTPRQT